MLLLIRTGVVLFIILEVMEGKLIKRGCGGGKYDDSAGLKNVGNVRPPFDRNGDVGLFYESARSFTLTTGEELKFESNAVPRLVDYNNDGRTDLLLASSGKVQVFYQTVTGKLEPGQALTTPGSIIDTGDRRKRRTGFAFGDINGDGFKDVILTKGSRRNLFYYPKLPNGGPLDFGHAVDLRTQLKAMRFDAADWDEDGDIDIIRGEGYGQISFIENTGNKTNPRFVSSKRIEEIGARAYSRYPRVMDLNNDGLLDIILSINWGWLSYCMQKERGVFEQHYLRDDSYVDLNVRKPYKEHHATDLQDFDGDGVLDLVTSGDSGHVLFFKGLKLMPTVTNNLQRVFVENPSNLGNALQVNNTLYKWIWDNHRIIQESVNFLATKETVKANILNWYIMLVHDFPHYLRRQQWSQPNIAPLAGYIWLIMYESQSNTRDFRERLANITGMTGDYRRIFVERNIIYVNNNKDSAQALAWIADYLMLKNADYYNLNMISHNNKLNDKLLRYTTIRNGKVNIAGSPRYGTNEFGSDCKVCHEEGRSPKMTQLLVIVAHEVSHVELDATKAKAYREDLYIRKYRLLQKGVEGHIAWRSRPEDGRDWKGTKKLFKRKGLWNGTGDFEAVAKAYFGTGPGKVVYKNMIRNDAVWFAKRPQEAFATLANQYASDSKLMLDFAMERAAAGYQLCVDWVFLIIDYYSMRSDKVPMFVIGDLMKGEVMKRYTTNIERDSHGFINKVLFDRSLSLPGPLTYTCSLDDEGFTTNCTAT